MTALAAGGLMTGGAWARSGIDAFAFDVMAQASGDAPAPRNGGAPSDDDDFVNDTSSANDPIEPVNRFIFEVNHVLDGVLLEPTARAYRFVTPRPARRSIANFLSNLRSPITLANDVLQGEFGRAGTTVSRFAINSTIGLVGLIDVAKGMGLEKHTEDFGQTLGVYGMGEGAYLVVPLLGPAPPRDLIGRGFDYLLDPLTWVGGDTPDQIQSAIFVAKTISDREANIDTFDEIERTSLDLYATVRSLYRQARDNAIANGESSAGDDGFPEIDIIAPPLQ